MSGSAYTRWYRVGTVNVTQGSRVITGINTYWLDAGLNPGDIFMTDLQTSYEIQEITDSTHITLSEAYQGATDADIGYKIIRNFTATLPADIAAKTAQLLGDFRRYVDTDMQSIQGRSAYEIAVSKGYVGTEADWLESLKASGDIQRIDGELADLDERAAWNKNVLTSSNRILYYPSKTSPTGGTLRGYSVTAAELAALDSRDTSDFAPAQAWSIPQCAYSWTDSAGTVHNVAANPNGTWDFRIWGVSQPGDVSNLLFGQAYGMTKHLLVMTDGSLFSARMHSTNDTSGGWTSMELYKDGMKRAQAIFEAVFGADHLLPFDEYLCNAVSNGVASGYAKVTCKVSIPTEAMLFGKWCQGYEAYTSMIDQVPELMWSKHFRGYSTPYWLRTPANATQFCVVDGNNLPGKSSLTTARNVRAYAIIYGGTRR